MGLDTTGIVILSVVGALLLLGGISRVVHGNGEPTLLSSDQSTSYKDGGTRRNKKKGTRSSRK